MSNHPGCVNKPVEYFQCKLEIVSVQTKVMKVFTAINKSAVYASYIASYEIAKQKEAHTITEKLILLVMQKVVKIMIREKVKN